jgi:hypothetical protein
MTTNILEASANPMAPTTQQAPDVAIASFISIASKILMVSAIPDGVPLDSAISARSSTISVGLAIPIESGILEASAVPPPVSPHFTPAAPTILTFAAPIYMLVPRQTTVSPAWLEDPLSYRAAMTPSSCVL